MAMTHIYSSVIGTLNTTDTMLLITSCFWQQNGISAISRNEEQTWTKVCQWKTPYPCFHTTSRIHGISNDKLVIAIDSVDNMIIDTFYSTSSSAAASQVNYTGEQLLLLLLSSTTLSLDDARLLAFQQKVVTSSLLNRHKMSAATINIRSRLTTFLLCLSSNTVVRWNEPWSDGMGMET